MKKIYLYFLLSPIIAFAQSVSITKIIESDCSSPFVKSVELHVTGTVDFGSEVTLNYMQNGSPWENTQIDISALGVITDSFVYIVRDIDLMQAEFPNTTFDATNTVVVDTATNGNDGYQVVLNGNVVSQFGKTETDADDDTIWEHDDSVVTRKSNIPDNGLWDETHWEYSGRNSLDGETFCRGGNGIEAFLSNLGGDFPLAYGPGTDFTLSPNTTGSFTFVPQSPLNRPPVKVFYRIPNGDITTMPILMSFHGSGRDGANHRDYWISMANENNFIVIAPEYSSANYPGLGDNYLMANIFDDGDNPTPETFNDKNEWTFSTLDPLFDYVKTAISGTQETYSAWGHSGGAQYLHRFVTYLPNSKLDIAVCSNAGWYTVPENGVSFPYGIDNGQLPTSDLISAFTRKLIVHLGQDDNDPNSSGLRRNDVVDTQQGTNRLVRGRYYYQTSQSKAQTMNTAFEWELHEVANVGHNAQRMANDALKYFLPKFLSTDNFTSSSVKIYPNPVTDYLQIDGIEIKKVKIYSILGNLIQANIEENRINVSHLTPGLYFVMINNEKVKFLKN